MAGPPLLHFNGVDPQEGGYFQAPTEQRDLLRRLAGRLPGPEAITTGVCLDVDPSSLAETGWGIVWPGAVDREVEAALAELLELRRAQTAGSGQGKFWSFEYQGESGEAFLSSHGASLAGPVKPEAFPYYLMLLGDATRIPFEVQHRLAQAHLVGRLCLDSPQAYAYYADNVVAAETGRVKRPRRAVIFAAHHRDDPPTQASLSLLARPLGADLSRVEGWRVEGVWAGDATKQRLSRLLGGDQTPLVLFTASHAVCYRPESRVLQAKQGGLLCSDWPGPVAWPEPSPAEHFLIAEDIDDDADLRGLITFNFGCFTAGTPLRDSFPALDDGRVTEGRLLAPEPFVAALPKRLLGHPQGGLACIGHVDRAWPHSFSWGEVPGQISAFESAVRGLMAGLSVGQAMAPFAERRGAVAEAVMKMWLRPRSTGEEKEKLEADLWIRYHDARSYVLLGDPAVKLPLERA